MTHTEPIRAKALPSIMIPASDYDRLAELAGTAQPPIATYLRRELVRAEIIQDTHFDARAARIGSRITYRDEPSGHTHTVTLTWPEESDIGRGRISVLTSIGAALLGMRPHSSIDWVAPLGGPRSLTVLAVSNDLERREYEVS